MMPEALRAAVNIMKDWLVSPKSDWRSGKWIRFPNVIPCATDWGETSRAPAKAIGEGANDFGSVFIYRAELKKERKQR